MLWRFVTTFWRGLCRFADCIKKEVPADPRAKIFGLRAERGARCVGFMTSPGWPDIFNFLLTILQVVPVFILICVRDLLKEAKAQNEALKANNALLRQLLRAYGHEPEV